MLKVLWIIIFEIEDDAVRVLDLGNRRDICN